MMPDRNVVARAVFEAWRKHMDKFTTDGPRMFEELSTRESDYGYAVADAVLKLFVPDMDRYDVYKFRGKELVLAYDDTNTELVKNMTGVLDGLLGTIKEAGRCDVGRYVIVPAGAPKPEPLRCG